ncbi:solute carrier family 26 protein [bacterium]|nr:solute carrier family 26 protein [candidate division CSSED10-310 bacterium]
MSNIYRLIPAFRWLSTYRKNDLMGDITAGLTVAVILVPQGMAYAMLAGLPPVIGLYASTIPLIVYALLGSSRHLAVGPVAMISLLVTVACSKLTSPGTHEYLSLVLLLAFMVGSLQFLLGIFKMGFLVNYLSHAVISGFTSAAAIIIALSQLKHLLGIQLTSSHIIAKIIREIPVNLSETHLLTVFIGIVSIILLFAGKRWFPKLPTAFVIVILSTAAVYYWNLEKYGLEIIRNVPSGIPDFDLPSLTWKSIQTLLPVAVTIVFVGYMESIAIAKSIASKEKYNVDPNQELLSLGAANIAASFFSGYPVTGGFSRTAINHQAGARTGLASIITACLIMLTLLFFTHLFYYLPKSVLAAIVIVAVMSLIDIKEPIRLFKIKKADGWTLILTFVITLSTGIETGILAGIIFSLIIFIWRSAHPHIAELGYLPEKNAFLNLQRFPQAKSIPNVLILRIDASLYFANAGFVENYLRAKIAHKKTLNWIIIDLIGVNDIDAVAVRVLEDLMESYEPAGISFAFSEIKGPVRDILARADWENKFHHHLRYKALPELLDELGLSYR